MTIYIKPMTWAGKTAFYLGDQPSNPSADPCYRLGRYFLVLNSLDSARAVAASEAKRLDCIVVECEHYVGYAR